MIVSLEMIANGRSRDFLFVLVLEGDSEVHIEHIRAGFQQFHHTKTTKRNVCVCVCVCVCVYRVLLFFDLMCLCATHVCESRLV